MDRRDIVVIGASAGGLDPLRALLAPLTVDFPAALFLVSHLGPGYSRLDEVIARSTSLKVLFAEDGELIRTGTLLIAPPDRHLILEADRVVLRRGPRENLWRPSIDVLFRSGAVAFRSRTVGIVLSGALDDGASGLRAIAACGGIPLVQNPSDATYPDMPEAALRAVPDARVLNAAAIGAALREIVTERAPPPPPVAELLQLESRVAAGDEKATRELEQRGELTNMSCPDCGGPLKREPGEASSFRCRIGHAFTAVSLTEASRHLAESSLWAAIRLLEQRANLDRARGAEERDRGRIKAATSYEQRAAEVNGHAQVLREMLVKLPAGEG